MGRIFSEGNTMKQQIIIECDTYDEAMEEYWNILGLQWVGI